MYCGQCGKKVMDNMLFCPFCGSPIVIPDQDDAAARPAPALRNEAADRPEAAEKSAAPEPKPEKKPEKKQLEPAYPASLFDAPAAQEFAPEEPEEEFVPLSFDFEEKAEAAEAPEEAPAETVEAEKEAPVDIPDEEVPAPARRPAPQTKRPQSARKRPANTYIPVKEIDPDDIFMDNEDDEYDIDEDYDELDEDYYYEDREDGSFFQRHVRGIVGLLLFIVLVAICAFWANTGRGQTILARFNLAWRAETYAELGYAAYQENNDLMAARYYEKALARDEDNYEYAHSAMVAYYEADQIEASASMLKRCIAMDPDNPEPYQELMILYPDAEQRPWEVKELIRQGYERTGDASLAQ